ncbi:MAG: anti-sigma factor [Acidobacteria bacterium]|nr:anti-sigma factor [Acidobacteriota bacterium]
MIGMLTCREVTRLLASDEYLDASWGRRLAIRLHLAMCRHCRRYASQMRAIRAAASALWNSWVQDPARLDRLERRIWAARGASPPPDTPSVGDQK